MNRFFISEEKSSAGKYRYSFNGMEKDDEVKGSGNSYDFGARMYDNRLGRWFSLDPHQSMYPGISPYHFSYNNPIIFKDPNGKDGRLVIDYENHTITLETTIHLYGANDSKKGKDVAAAFNKQFSQVNNIQQVKDPNNPEIVWTVKFDVKFVYNEQMDKTMEDMGLSKLKDPTDTSEETFNLYNNNGANLAEGDNIYKMSKPAGQARGHAWRGTKAAMGEPYYSTAIHEIFHLLGFDERYQSTDFGGMTIERYEKDVLSNHAYFGGKAIQAIHFINLLDYGLNRYSESGTYLESTKITKKVFEYIDLDGMKVAKKTLDRNIFSIDDTKSGTSFDYESETEESRISDDKK